MKKVLLIVTTLFFVLSGTVFATVINFDGLGIGSLGSYGGLTWNNMYSYTYSDYNTGWSNTLTSVSGDGFAYNFSGLSARVGDGSDFDFNGAYLTGWLNNDAEWYANAPSVTIQGYNNGSLIDTFEAKLTVGTMSYFDVGMAGVNEIVFTTIGEPKWFLMDDFTYNESAPVPEPSTLLLLGSGLLGLAWYSRKRKKA